LREKRSDPAEVSSDVAAAGTVELSVSLGRECAGEEDSKKKKDNPANFAREGGARRLIVPVPARAS